VIGTATIRSADREPPHEGLLGDRPLNDEQKKAITRSFGSNATFVWGPPGTGKTYVLARIVEAFYRSGQSVLLVSNTNVAVDTALEKVADRLKFDPGFHGGAVIRYGPIAKDELRDKYGKQVVLDDIIARLEEDLEKQKQTLQHDLEARNAEVEPIRIAIREHENLEALRSQCCHAQESLEATRGQQEQAQRELDHQASLIQRLQIDLDRARSMGTIRRFLTRLDPDRLNREIGAAEAGRRAAQDAIQAAASQFKTQGASFRSLQQQAADLERHLWHRPSLADCRARARDLEDLIQQLTSRLQEIQAQLDALRNEVLKRCRVLATTVYRTYLKGQVDRSFDVVVVDEASMLMLPMTFYAAGLAQDAVVVAGDFRQLPPIVTSDDPLAKEWLEKDAFAKSDIPNLISPSRQPAHLVGLRVQYRMHQGICDVINDLFYHEHRLTTGASVIHRPASSFPLGHAPLLYVDTAPLQPWSAMRLGSFSRYNLLHALLIRNLVVHLADENYLHSGGGPNELLGAVAPYAAQTRLLQALLQDRFGTDGLQMAATVHRFQGNEKNAILVDLTDSHGTVLGRFMKSTQIEETGARLLNVAVSRAREHVILVANFEYLRAKAPPSGYVNRLLDRFEEQGELLDVGALLRLGQDDWITGLQAIGVGEFHLPKEAEGWFTEGTFYPAFAQDLRDVRKSIVIFSPFITQRGASRWVDFLRPALEREVAVRLVTRPPGDQGGVLEQGLTETIEQLRRLGVVVDLRKRMHEKIAIVDEEILWHGSLNILSHRDTSESMLRISSRSACEQLAHFVTTPVGRKDTRPEWGAGENPSCLVCGRATVWNDGRFGIYFKCEDEQCPGIINAKDRGRSHPQATPKKAPGWSASRACPSPGCGGRLMQRTGRRGGFLGCTHYPRCRYTEDSP
jgi:hypothetical protein